MKIAILVLIALAACGGTAIIDVPTAEDCEAELCGPPPSTTTLDGAESAVSGSSCVCTCIIDEAALVAPYPITDASRAAWSKACPTAYQAAR